MLIDQIFVQKCADCIENITQYNKLLHFSTHFAYSARSSSLFQCTNHLTIFALRTGFIKLSIYPTYIWKLNDLFIGYPALPNALIICFSEQWSGQDKKDRIRFYHQ